MYVLRLCVDWIGCTILEDRGEADGGRKGKSGKVFSPTRDRAPVFPSVPPSSTPIRVRKQSPQKGVMFSRFTRTFIAIILALVRISPLPTPPGLTQRWLVFGSIVRCDTPSVEAVL